MEDTKYKVGERVIVDYGDEVDYAMNAYGSEARQGRVYVIEEVIYSVFEKGTRAYKLKGTNYHLESWLRPVSKIMLGGERQ